MFLAGTNFVLSYFIFTRKFQKIIAYEEFKVYLSFILIFTALTSIVLLSTDVVRVLGESDSANSIEISIRAALFQVVAVITTTGFVSADFTQWTPFLTIVFF